MTKEIKSSSTKEIFKKIKKISKEHELFLNIQQKLSTQSYEATNSQVIDIYSALQDISNNIISFKEHGFDKNQFENIKLRFNEVKNLWKLISSDKKIIIDDNEKKELSNSMRVVENRLSKYEKYKTNLTNKLKTTTKKFGMSLLGGSEEILGESDDVVFKALFGASQVAKSAYKKFKKKKVSDQYLNDLTSLSVSRRKNSLTSSNDITPNDKKYNDNEEFESSIPPFMIPQEKMEQMSVKATPSIYGGGDANLIDALTKISENTETTYLALELYTNPLLEKIVDYNEYQKQLSKDMRMDMLEASREKTGLIGGDISLGEKSKESAGGKGLLGGLLGGGVGIGVAKKAMGGLSKVLFNPITALVTGLVWAAVDGISGWMKSSDWGVSKISGFIGGFFGGTGDNAVKRTLAGMGKWALIGAGIGSFFPVIGTAIGGLIGAALGGILGWIGGENISGFLDDFGLWMSDSWSTGFDMIKNFFLDLWDTAQNMIDSVLNVTDSIKLAIVNWVKGTIDWLVDKDPTGWAKGKFKPLTDGLGEMQDGIQSDIDARAERRQERDRAAKERRQKAQEAREARNIAYNENQEARRLKQAESGGKYDDLGSLSAKYESGNLGSGAIGFDKTGGTSYGKYQIATRTGTMNRFMNYLKENNPEAYERLSAAGPADAGKSGKFAQEWKALAKEGVLGTSEHDFIKKTHFDVGMKGIKNKELQAMVGKNKALQEVMWSSSVQHGGGGAAGIFNKVYKEGMTEQDLIKAVYAERGTRFGRSSAGVRRSVKNRFLDEQKRSLAMLNQPQPQVQLASMEDNTPKAKLLKGKEGVDWVKDVDGNIIKGKEGVDWVRDDNGDILDMKFDNERNPNKYKKVKDPWKGTIPNEISPEMRKIMEEEANLNKPAKKIQMAANQTRETPNPYLTVTTTKSGNDNTQPVVINNNNNKTTAIPSQGKSAPQQRQQLGTSSRRASFTSALS